MCLHVDVDQGLPKGQGSSQSEQPWDRGAGALEDIWVYF